jgi:ribonuclease-3
VPDFARLEQQIGVQFRDKSLLEQSFVHRSYLNETPAFPLLSNERLEFLGDALIGLAVAEEMFVRFPEYSEGDLTKLRAALVRKESLARVAVRLNLGEYIYLGRGEEMTGGRAREVILASTYEALAGAVFMDRGYRTARAFVRRTIGPQVKRVLDRHLAVDEKSRLQELVQSRRQPSPVYRVIAEEGPNHDKTFTVQVTVGGTALALGQGKSKQRAEKEAARAALRTLLREPEPETAS